MAVLVQHGEQSGYTTVKAAADDGHPEGRDERRDEFDVSNEIDHHEEDRECDGCADHETDPERLAQLCRFGILFGVSVCLVMGCVGHPPDIRQIRTSVGTPFPPTTSVISVHPLPDPDLAVAYLDGKKSAEPLFVEARRLRDEGKGRIVTYSPKVFIPLTTMCRDQCTYCTFVKPPGNGGVYLTPDDVMAIALAGDQHGCTEALFTLGDAPETKYPAAREFLSSVGCATTMDYVVSMTERVHQETGLFPHANPGVMAERAIAKLRLSNPSIGLMLENISPRLTEPGMPHFNCPDKIPSVRVATIEAAGRQRVPFTSGILVGIGETNQEIVDSIFALASLQERWGHIQEVIIQNFRAKADTRDALRRRTHPELVRQGRSARQVDHGSHHECSGSPKSD